jgi:hypothetical protein
MAEETSYEFPLKDKFQVREVTEIDFDIEAYKDKLYVDLTEVRDNDFWETLVYDLGVNPENNKLEKLTKDFVKIIFSGHIGSGKTLELRRFQEYINDRERYLSVFIEVEKVFEVARFQPEDFFIMLITELVKTLQANHIPLDFTELTQLEKDWLSTEEIKKEITKSTKGELEIEKSVGINIPTFFQFSTKIKALFSAETKTATEIRQKVRTNSLEYINQFNAILYQVRNQISARGKDILFVIDGSEKLEEINTNIFVKQSYLLRAINANMICSVPITMHYKVQNSNALGFYADCLLPMIKLNDRSKVKLKEIITRRIDKKTFFPDDEVLDLMTTYSGGSIRQLLRIANAMFRHTRGQVVTMEKAKEALAELGRKMWELLKTEEITILKEGLKNNSDFKVADEKITLLVFSLILLKYNDEIKLNPLLESYFPTT